MDKIRFSFVFLALSVGSLFLLSGCTQAPPAPPVSDTVSVQYLYADWCHYCQNTTMQLDLLAPSFGSRLSIERLNEADRATNSSLAKLYDDYKSSGVFGGFPTLVAHGPKGPASFVGYHEPAALKAWLCAQYVTAPQTCAGN